MPARATAEVPIPTIDGPVTDDASSPFIGASSVALATVGYVMEEFFLSGAARSFTAAGPLSSDGLWEVTPAGSAPYTTRVVVRRPVSVEDFNGTVVVEWLNVSGGLDADPGWTYLHEELIRRGVAWVGVSAQSAGVEGGGDGLGAALALKNADPGRYGPLDHPGDDFSYDIFTQAGAAVWVRNEQPLGGASPVEVLAIGQSQSAFRLTTYINALAPIVDVYGGYFIHSRAAFAAPLRDGLDAPMPTMSRTDLEVPVMVLSTETDLPGTRLGYARARQDDGPHFVAWEVAGTAHVDAYGLGIGDGDHGHLDSDIELFEAMFDPPSSVYFGVIDCGCPINTGPHVYVARAAYVALEEWVRTGTRPRSHPRLELTADGTDLVRDADGNAVGGIRTPHVDVPVATLSGLGQDDDSFCGLFGTTVPFSPEELQRRYGAGGFLPRWEDALRHAMDEGVILSEDAAHLREAARRSRLAG